MIWIDTILAASVALVLTALLSLAKPWSTRGSRVITIKPTSADERLAEAMTFSLGVISWLAVLALAAAIGARYI